MVTNNAINLKTAGIPTYDGAGTFSAGTNLTVTDGVCYYDGSLIQTTAVGTAGQILTSNGAAVAPTFQENVRFIKKTLLSSDIKTVAATPFVLVPAQGANTVIMPITATAKYIYGGNNAFTGGSLLAFRYINWAGAQAGGAAGGGIFSVATLQGTANGFGTSVYLSTNSDKAVGVLDNVPIVITSAGPEYGGNAADNNTIIVELCYIVVTLT